MHPPGGAHRHGARRGDQPLAAASTARITSTPICRRAIRSASSTIRWSGEGEVEILLDEKDENSAKQIGIERIHVEQDAGKLMHDQHPTMSYVDLNRCGVALMEIVSRPDMRSPAEAGAYLRKLRAILRYVGSCDGNMEEGSMRADVNVSVRKPGGEFGTRTETKNVNSVRFVMAVVEHEAKRQVELIEGGGAVAQETRLFDPDKGVTRSLRSKEDAHDYRYFPDPGPAPARARRGVPRRMQASRCPSCPTPSASATKALGITPYNASVLTAEVETARWFDALLDAGAEPKQARQLGRRRAVRRAQPPRRDRSTTARSRPTQAAELLRLVADGTISGTIAKQVFEIMLETGEAPSTIVEERGLKQTSDTGAIDAEIDKILAANADKVAEYKAGKEALFGFFVGQTMKAMAGKANPQVVNERLRAKLDWHELQLDGSLLRMRKLPACRVLRGACVAPHRRRPAPPRLPPAGRPSCSSSSRSTSSRPTCSTNTARISPAAWRGSRAGRCSATAIRATPRPRPARAIRPSSPAITRRAPGSSPTSGSTSRVAAVRQERLLRRGRARAGHVARSTTRSRPMHLARADARRADEGALAGQPQRRRRGQGPRGGDDERPSSPTSAGIGPARSS